MVDQDISRLSRLTAIITLLMSRSVVPASEIMEKFNISVRTVYRDIRALEEAGVPISNEPSKGYSITQGYKLPPMMFSREESVAFMTAEKFMDTMADADTSKAFRSATQKIKSLLRQPEKHYVENMDASVVVLHNPYLPFGSDDLKYWHKIISYINEKKVIGITYQAVNSYESSTREIEPIGVYFASSRWYLVAYCQLKNDYRNFRIDKISDVKPSEQNFTKQHPTLKDYMQNMSKEEQPQYEVIIKMKKSDVQMLGEQKFYMGFVEERLVGDDVFLTFMTSSLVGFAKGYFMFGDYADIISPQELKEVAKQIGENILKKLV